MGCGESKHDVATGNTINRKKSDAGNGKSKDIETIKETSTNDDKTNSLVQPEENQNVSKNSGDDDNVGANAIADVKDKNGTKELKEEGTELEKTEVAVEEQEEGRLISKESPNHFFSSRKDEDIEGLAYEGRSEKSEYCSPRIESVKESLFNESDYEKEALVEETKQKNENGLQT